jgi:hypothetical protein
VVSPIFCLNGSGINGDESIEPASTFKVAPLRLISLRFAYQAHRCVSLP